MLCWRRKERGIWDDTQVSYMGIWRDAGIEQNLERGGDSRGK